MFVNLLKEKAVSILIVTFLKKIHFEKPATGGYKFCYVLNTWNTFTLKWLLAPEKQIQLTFQSFIFVLLVMLPWS